MDENDRYLDLIAVLHYIYGALTALVSCFPLIHVAVGIAMIVGAFDTGADAPPAWFGIFFVLIGGIIIAIGWSFAIAIIMAGRKIKARRSRMFCVVVAALMCVMFPFGTALGIFTLIFLMKDAVVAKFA